MISIHCPSHLFVVPSAVSEIIGTDLEGICLTLSRELNSRVIPISGLSLDNNHTEGVRRILTLLADTVITPPKSRQIDTFNIIGPGMDCYNYLADIRETIRLMAGAFGFSPKAIFTAETSMHELATTGEAACNIVLRSEGIECCEILKERFGQPYHYGAPYGIKGTLAWLESVAGIIDRQPSAGFVEREEKEASLLEERLKYHARIAGLKSPTFVVCGTYDLLKWMVPFIRDELGFTICASILTHPVSNDMVNDILFFKSDIEKYECIASAKPDFLLADAITLQTFRGKVSGIQVSNPNLAKVRRFAYTPFMGFRGVQMLTQDLANLFLLS